MKRQEAATTKRLDRIDRNLQRLERDVGIAVETVALFVPLLACHDAVLARGQPNGCEGKGR
jgi:hypothetical protein